MEPDAVVDTCVLRYFGAVGELDLLLQLLNDPMATSRIVYDHEEPEAMAPQLRCEVERSIAYQLERSTDTTQSPDRRTAAAQLAAGLADVRALQREGHLVVFDMRGREHDLFGQLTGPTARQKFGTKAALDPGEAGCLALAISRGLAFASDDKDALRALERIAPGHRYERIRKLLFRAGEVGLRSAAEANAIHAEMRSLGFWDTGRPFPS